MSSFEIHSLGIELEQTNRYLRPEFPPEGHNSADYYDYGNDLLVGIALGTAKLKSLAGALPGDRSAGSALVNIDVALGMAHEAMTAMQNEPGFDVHSNARCMAIAVRLLHAAAAFHANAAGKHRMYE